MAHRSPCNYNNIQSKGDIFFIFTVSLSYNSFCTVSVNGVSDLFSGSYTKTVIGLVVCPEVDDRMSAYYRFSFSVKKEEILVIIQSFSIKHNYHTAAALPLKAFFILCDTSANKSENNFKVHKEKKES